MVEKFSKPDIAHLEWAIEQRSKIQLTLLGLYKYMRKTAVDDRKWVKPLILDDLIAAAFSLWRAVFLAETIRTSETIHEAQESFLATVISTNTITFSDDRRTSAWMVGFYLENAKHRLLSAHHAAAWHMKDQELESVVERLRLKGTNDVRLTCYEWESIHMALRIILRILDPESNLAIEPPTAPTA